MNNSHGYSTRQTTKIQQSIDELAAQLTTRKKMTNDDQVGGAANGDGHASVNVTPKQMELLLMELANIREEMGQLKIQQGRQEVPIINDMKTTTMQVVVNTDPLQQMKDFVKSFHGNSEEDVYKWIESIVHYFNVAKLAGTQEELYFQYAPAFLKDYAYKWWKENKRNDWNWAIFKQSIIEQFGKTNEYLIARQLDQRKQQFNEPVIKYYYDVVELCNKYDPDMSDKQKIYKLTNGLQLSLYQEAVKDVYTTPTEFLTKVQQIENVHKLIEHRQMQMRAPTGWNDQPFANQSNWYNTNRNDQRQNNYEQQQMTTNTNQAYATLYKTNGQIQCYKCHEIGHISRNCPKGNNYANAEQTTIQKNE